MDSSEEMRQKGGALKLVLVVGFALAGLYVLSIGPVARSVRGQSTAPTLEAFYAPLIWVCENTALERPMEWYVDLWTGNEHRRQISE